MKYSFIIIAYNEEKNIRRTILSILAQRGLQDYEIIAVNDGSVDGTLKALQDLVASHPEIRIIDLQPNRGRGAARATGIDAARGDYYALVDADIVLPEDWLEQCLPYMKAYDACGGIAVPDGDVSFVHRICRLEPKAARHAATVTGSNGLFRNTVFSKVNFDPDKKNGEDVALNFQIKEQALKTLTVPGLLVAHLETKSYKESLRWLFQSGRGASRQFYEHPALRIPDLAFLIFVLVSLAAVAGLAFSLLPWWVTLGAVLAYVSASSFLHLYTKFYLLRGIPNTIAAIFINNTILLSYYIGRIVGLCVEWKDVR